MPRLAQAQALAKYASSDAAAALPPMAARLLATLVVYAATHSTLTKPFVLADRRRHDDDPPAVQDLLPATREGGKAMHHNTIGEARKVLIARGFIKAERKRTRHGATDGPGTPFIYE